MSDPFAILGVPQRFDLDPDELHAKFIAAAAANHPDRFTDPVEQAEAAARSAAINEAYDTLSDPERRADALLRLIGGPAKEDDKSLPPDLLMEMMAVREQMERAIAADDRAELDRLHDWARDRRSAHLGRIGELFNQPDPPAIRLELNALRYIERMLEQMPADSRGDT